MRSLRISLSVALLLIALLLSAPSVAVADTFTACFPGPPLVQTTSLPSSICSDPAYASCCNQTNGWWTLRCVEKAAAGYQTDFCSRNAWTQTKLPGTEQSFPRDFNLVALGRDGRINGLTDVDDPVAARTSVQAANFNISKLGREPVAIISPVVDLCNGTVHGNVEWSTSYTPKPTGCLGSTTLSPSTATATKTTPLPIDFSAANNPLFFFSHSILQAPRSTGIAKNGSTLTFTADQKQQEVNVFSLPGSMFSGVTSIVFKVPQTSSVIVSILLDPGNPPITIANASVTGINPSNLLWNIEQTSGNTNVTISSMQFIGSINAPTATVTLNNSQTTGTIVASAVFLHSSEPHSAPYSIPTVLGEAKQIIKHVVVIMQENRSFDSYFGTFTPVAGQTVNGIPQATLNGSVNYTCGAGGVGTYKPFHQTSTTERDFPHSHGAFVNNIHGTPAGTNLPINASGNGQGFIDSACKQGPFNSPNDLQQVVGYHTAAEIPTYWNLAKTFILQDNMFQSVASWSAVEHTFMVSGWNADCTSGTCLSDIGGDPNNVQALSLPKKVNGTYNWSNIADVLRGKATWKFYEGKNWNHNCGQTTCSTTPAMCFGAADSVPAIWSPMGSFKSVQDTTGEAALIAALDTFYTDVATNNLPKVSWIVPGNNVSEHANNATPVSTVDIKWGQAYVAAIINSIMSNQALWSSTAIFLSWDDWGGFYDHVSPPVIANDDGMGYGMRVPGLLISPWVVQPGFVDHQQLSHDAYLKFIEDLFAGGTRISPPRNSPSSDNRPNQRDNLPGMGDLLKEFDFGRPPSAPLTGMTCSVP